MSMSTGSSGGLGMKPRSPRSMFTPSSTSCSCSSSSLSMVTAPAIQTGVDGNLPQAKRSETIPDDEGKLT